MSNQIIFYTQIGSIVLFVSSLFVLYRLLVQQKDATIEALKEKNLWLQDQVSALKAQHPDALLDNLERRLRLATGELEKLNADQEQNIAAINAKQGEVEELVSEIEHLKSRIDECPHCGSQLIRLGGEEEEEKAYECGYSIGWHEHPCPYDPNFPTLDEYDLKVKHYPDRHIWICTPEPITEMAKKLKLNMMVGPTRETAISGVEKQYSIFARNVPKKKDETK